MKKIVLLSFILWQNFSDAIILTINNGIGVGTLAITFQDDSQRSYTARAKTLDVGPLCIKYITFHSSTVSVSKSFDVPLCKDSTITIGWQNFNKATLTVE